MAYAGIRILMNTVVKILSGNGKWACMVNMGSSACFQVYQLGSAVDRSSKGTSLIPHHSRYEAGDPPPDTTSSPPNGLLLGITLLRSNHRASNVKSDNWYNLTLQGGVYDSVCILSDGPGSFRLFSGRRLPIGAE